MRRKSPCWVSLHLARLVPYLGKGTNLVTFQSAHWNRNQSFDYPVDSQYVPTYLGSILCVSSYAIACCSAGWYLPHPAVASSPFGSAAWPTPASCFQFIVIAIPILTLTVTFSVFPAWSLTWHTLLLPRVSLAGYFLSWSPWPLPCAFGNFASSSSVILPVDVMA